MEEIPNNLMITEKEAKLEEIRKKVNECVDKLGKGIDDGIKESIVMFSAFDINTTASCEGHPDHGTGGPFPFIDVEAKDVWKLDKRLEEIKGNEIEEEKIISEIERKNLEERKKLMPYLDEFYKNRDVPYDKKLIIQSLARGWSRIESQGVGLQKIETDENKKKNLAEFQKEMQEFTKFLKDKYFENK